MEVSRSAAARFIRNGRDRAQRAAGRIVVGALVCAASMMCATSARAQLPSTSAPQVSRSQDNQQDFPFGDNDPCIASVVAGQGHFHSQFTDRSTATTSDTTFSIHQNGQGANTVPGDGAQYQFQYWADQRFQSSTTNFTFTTQLRKHIIREGPLPPGLTKDDYFAQESVTFSPLSPMPSINSFKSESTCK
jgi:hypothetical protein